jgi:hypothetical protein
MEHGKVRVVLLGYAEPAAELLQRTICADGIFVLCGTCSNWDALRDTLEREVPDVLIARKGCVPSGWVVSSTSLLWVAGSPTLDAIASGATFESSIPSLRNELSGIYANVLDEKARQLRTLLQSYQESMQARSCVTELRMRHEGTDVAVPIHHVEWIEGAGNWVRIHTPHGVYPLREMINEVLEKLPDTQFVRIHRSTVVNRHRIAEVTTQNDVPIALVMQSGVSLSVGVTFREPLRDKSLLAS